MTTFPLLSFIVFTPWIGAALLVLFRGASSTTSRVVALVFSLSTLGWTGLVLTRFEPALTGPQFVEDYEWISALNVHYRLGLDGLSLVLVLLTGIITPAALLASWRVQR